jgi:hypothetical protein
MNILYSITKHCVSLKKIYLELPDDDGEVEIEDHLINLEIKIPLSRRFFLCGGKLWED